MVVPLRDRRGGGSGEVSVRFERVKGAEGLEQAREKPRPHIDCCAAMQHTWSRVWFQRSLVRPSSMRTRKTQPGELNRMPSEGDTLIHKQQLTRHRESCTSSHLLGLAGERKTHTR